MSGSYNTLSGQLNAILLRLNSFIASAVTLAGNNIFTGLNTFTQNLTLFTINGGGNAGQFLTSAGNSLPVYWSDGGGGSVGSLGSVLENGNIASKAIDMNDFEIQNISNLSLNVTVNNANLTYTKTSIPITINGTVYYLQLFQNT